MPEMKTTMLLLFGPSFRIDHLFTVARLGVIRESERKELFGSDDAEQLHIWKMNYENCCRALRPSAIDFRMINDFVWSLTALHTMQNRSKSLITKNISFYRPSAGLFWLRNLYKQNLDEKK